MVEQMLAVMILTAIVITALGIVVGISNPLIESSKDTTVMREAEYLMKLLDDNIREVAAEGANARRILDIRPVRELETFPGEDAVQTSFQSKARLLDYLTRSASGNIIYIAGNDVSCSNVTDIVVENTFLNVTFKKTIRGSPLSTINTTENIISIKEKTGGTQVTFVNTSIVLNGNQSTARGTGYSELLRSGKSLPACTAHFFVNNSAIEYDAYYTLYAGADFLVVDVKNIKEM